MCGSVKKMCGKAFIRLLPSIWWDSAVTPAEKSSSENSKDTFVKLFINFHIHVFKWQKPWNTALPSSHTITITLDWLQWRTNTAIVLVLHTLLQLGSVFIHWGGSASSTLPQGAINQLHAHLAWKPFFLLFNTSRSSCVYLTLTDGQILENKIKQNSIF